MNEIKENIIKGIQAYLSDANFHYAILISGQWGSGKTYFIKDLMKSWVGDDIGVESIIQIKPIYVSLNGIWQLRDYIALYGSKYILYLILEGLIFSN